MIILSDLGKPKILLPIPRREWSPSIGQRKDVFGNENQTRFRVRALLDDGHPAWVGWFDDRDDFDAFLWAIATGSLPHDRYVQQLPIPCWPGLDPGLRYDFVTVSFITTTGSWPVPVDCIGVSGLSGEFIDTIGGGGSGGVSFGGIGASGAGGGGWSRVTSGVSLTPGGSATAQIGSGAASVSTSSFGSFNGNAGGDTWFNGASLAASSVGAKGGGGGSAISSVGAVAGGAGGAAASGVGATKRSGGRGGNVISGSSAVATGAGGAAGTNANGNQGVDDGGTPNTGTAGGSGDGGSGGAGSAGNGAGSTSVGGNGAEYDSTHGSGGGSGGANNFSSPVTTGNGGGYGGGSGGIRSGGGTGTCTTGVGYQGLAVVSYNPVAKSFPNLPMMGF